MRGRARQQTGRLGEEAVVSIYDGGGYRVVARNWRCRLGELDLVVAGNGLLIFCEVKTRRTASLGPPFEAVTTTKQQRLRRLAEAFISARRPPLRRVRFDVASVTLRDGRPPNVEIFEDAF